MNSYLLLVIATGVVLFSILYLFSSFSYQISQDSIVIQWKLLKYVPFNSRTIDISNVRQIRRFELKKDILFGANIWGNLFTKEGVIIILKEGFFKRVYLTPEEADKFIAEVEGRIRQ